MGIPISISLRLAARGSRTAVGARTAAEADGGPRTAASSRFALGGAGWDRRTAALDAITQGGATVRLIHKSVRHLMIVPLVTVAGLAITNVANAACVGGVSNTCFGTGVLVSATGVANTGIGSNALQQNTTGSANTASGAYALQSNTTGSANTASGYGALKSNTTGNYNTATGYSSLEFNSTGSFNTASGTEALYGNSTGSYNAANGFGALLGNTTGNYNTASGFHALFASFGSSNNTAVGYEAMYGDEVVGITGNNNTASGSAALRGLTTGNNNTASGSYALYKNTTGYRNVAFGYNAGYAITTGSDNIILGAANQGVAAENGVIRIGNKTYQKKAFIAGIRGVTTGSATASTVFVDVNGQLGTIKSSRRYKEDIQTMDSVSEKLFGLRPVTFRYTQPFDDGSKPVQYGLIAEEVADVFPELVVYGEDGKPETVSYHLLATLLLNEVQKEHLMVEALRRDNDAQAARMAALEQQVAVLAKAAERAEKDRMVASTK